MSTETLNFLKEFFENEVGEIPSDKELKDLMGLRFGDGRPVFNPRDESRRIEVLAMFRDLGYDKVMEYLSSDKTVTFEDMVFYSEIPAMVNTRKAVTEKREVLTRELPTPQIGFGTCARCKSENVLMLTVQTSSGDEAMRTTYQCQECPFSWRG